MRAQTKGTARRCSFSVKVGVGEDGFEGGV